ncbi:MAG: hypothetical protein H7332_03575 [Bdellovibrionales bacterium]|nr:hypothetical protein [Ramlibacter sp.]
MTPYKLMLVDSDPYTASVLLEDLRARGLGQASLAASPLELPQLLEHSAPDAVIFNYHSDRPDSLTACGTIRLMAPKAAVIVIVSPGPALKQVRAWTRQTHSIDVIIEKPLSDERFFMAVQDLLNARRVAREMEARAAQLANLVPEGAMPGKHGNLPSEAEMFDAVVVFTDIRNSSRLIRQMPPHEFFEVLNEVLSSHARQVGVHEGAIVKFTGDGAMAIFRGMGRSYLAMRCAIEIAKMSTGASMPFGVGVAQGLVIAGLLGDSAKAGQRRQYDVIGATVHLSARLCAMAEAGTVMCTRAVSQAARLHALAPEPAGQVAVRGFDTKVDCVVFNLLT